MKDHKIKYRPDIDGLRAVAVLAVVGFHAFPDWIQGGFIGVDIFFVISGYLISTIIFESLDQKTFSFHDFYARRIKRIFPALIMVLVACFIFGWFALLADEYKQLGKHIAAGASFLSNFMLLSESGYFDNAAETKPLLHLWSLGVEEQFYIVWPVALWFAWKSRFNLLTLTVFVALISFYLNIRGIKHDATATFYLPQTRFWELMSGSVLAWCVLYQKIFLKTVIIKIDGWLIYILYQNFVKNDGKTLSNIFSFIGCLLLTYGFLNIDKGLSFPGKWALIPVVGAVFVILAGSQALINRTILSNRVVVWFGLISFPLYLWHWPILSFLQIIKGDTPHSDARILAVLISIILAWFTYKFIECPIRFGKKSKVKIITLVVFMGVVGGVGYNTYKSDGLSFRLKEMQEFNDYFNSISEYKYPGSFVTNAYRHQCNFWDIPKVLNEGGVDRNQMRDSIASECYVRNHAPYSVFLWGDSHAQQLYYGLSKALTQDWQIFQVTTSGCGVNMYKKVGFTKGELCEKSNEFALGAILNSKPDVVLISQYNPLSTSDALMLKNKLVSIGVKKVIFVGPVPRWKDSLPKIVTRKHLLLTPRYLKENIDNYFLLNSTNKKMYGESNLLYADLISKMCNVDKGCLVYLGSDVREGLTTLDYGHLLPIASVFVAENALVPMIEEPIK
jgi:peptidoglycan/LPS O-acetylase OafA/YrhL